MEKKIQDYLHYYLGCEGRMRHGEIQKLTTKILHDVLRGVIEFTPHLSKLEDMSEEELQECGNMVYDFSAEPALNNHRPEDFQLCAPEQYHYLISKGYWLFGNDWFDEGLIIDKKTLQS